MTVIAGIVVVAAAATLGDFIWYTVGVRHTMVAGLVHGALLLTAVGGALGAASGRLAKGLPLGTLAGLGGAFSYYVLIVVLDSRPDSSHQLQLFAKDMQLGEHTVADDVQGKGAEGFEVLFADIQNAGDASVDSEVPPVVVLDN